MSIVTQVPLDDLVALCKKARECAQDLAAELQGRYPARDEQPVQKRRFDRDYQIVTDTFAAIDRLAAEHMVLGKALED